FLKSDKTRMQKREKRLQLKESFSSLLNQKNIRSVSLILLQQYNRWIQEEVLP
ncbi:MAG: hypothetical protein ACI9P5_004864, partial [Saprospiraceae bacterium]